MQFGPVVHDPCNRCVESHMLANTGTHHSSLIIITHITSLTGCVQTHTQQRQQTHTHTHTHMSMLRGEHGSNGRKGYVSMAYRQLEAIPPDWAQRYAAVLTDLDLTHNKCVEESEYA